MLSLVDEHRNLTLPLQIGHFSWLSFIATGLRPPANQPLSAASTFAYFFVKTSTPPLISFPNFRSNLEIFQILKGKKGAYKLRRLFKKIVFFILFLLGSFVCLLNCKPCLPPVLLKNFRPANWDWFLLPPSPKTHFSHFSGSCYMHRLPSYVKRNQLWIIFFWQLDNNDEFLGNYTLTMLEDILNLFVYRANCFCCFFFNGFVFPDELLKVKTHLSFSGDEK